MRDGIEAVLVDRDGVLNRYLPDEYVKTPDELELIVGVESAIRRLNEAGLKVVVISNQQGVGKGLMTEADLSAVTRELNRRLDLAGAAIDRQYYCTDLKDSNSDRRKPRPGMLFEAAHDLEFDIEKAVFVGDSESDMIAARGAGVAYALLVLSGATGEEPAAKMWPAPDEVFASLAQAVDWILEESE